MAGVDAGTALLALVTAAQAALSIDKWVHRQQRQRQSLEYQTTGQPSLAARIESLVARLAALERTVAAGLATVREERAQMFATEERLRLERAGQLANELARLSKQVVDISARSSDYADDQQEKIGRVEERIILLHQRFAQVEARVDQIDQRRAMQPREHGERRRDGA